MSKLTDMLRSVKVYNAHEFYNGAEPSGQVYIVYTPATYGLAALSPHWTVLWVGHVTGPLGEYRPYNHRVWVTGGRGSFADRKAAALAVVQQWATERYGITDWKRDPFGSYGSGAFIDARLAELKAAAKQIARQRQPAA